MCFDVDDLDEIHRRMLTFQADDQLANGIGTKVAYFDDPDGIHLEIIEPQGPFKRETQKVCILAGSWRVGRRNSSS
ncbi:VOC family protein [Pseudaminobacter soli (ex Li et al. 2025)]|uniref:VOC family protein n=1 Tax=Pseudaminobacter soli (ex Li et al. 2025) TaxID=1295366 RepID=UPI0011B291B8|nr:hypothetical protein [Mesorhizobium soli]